METIFNYDLKSSLSEYQVRNKSIGGTDYLVVPVIMMREGVHNGSGGALFYSSSELELSVSKWLDAPVVIDHPTDESGTYIQARDSDTEVIGMIRNPRMEEDKLRAEAWLNKDVLKNFSEETYDRIMNGEAMDVSIGVLCEGDGIEGDWHGEAFISSTSNYIPDHLALLPNDQGACSWNDGCGLRDNKKQSLTKNKMDEKVKFNEQNVVLTLDGKTTSLFVSKELYNNEIGYREIGQQAQSKLDQLDSSLYYNYLEEVFSDYVVYRAVNREDGTFDYYKRNFEVNDDQVEFSDDPVKMQKRTPYAIENNSKQKMERTKFKKKTIMANENPCRVTTVLNSGATNLTEDDRARLTEMNDADFLAEVLANLKTPEAPKPKDKEFVGEVTAEQVQSVISNLSKDDPYAFLPEEMRNTVENAMTVYANQKKKMISEIVNNSDFTEEELQSWKQTDLEKLHKNLVPVEENTDFSVNVEGVVNESDPVGDDFQHMLDGQNPVVEDKE